MDDSEQQRAFKYEGRLSDGEIRLLEVLELEQSTSVEDCKVQLRLNTSTLDPQLSYTAISYVWGDPRPKHKISVNQQTYHVAENLYQLLEHLIPQARTDQKFWLDAICINQLDDEERSSQVAAMRSIYQGGETVWAWVRRLGDNEGIVSDFLDPAEQEILNNPGNSDAAFDFLDSAGQQLLKEPSIPIKERLHSASHMIENLCSRETVSQALFWAVHELLRHELWTRTWILQELILGRRIWFWNGMKFLGDHRLMGAILMLRNDLHGRTDMVGQFQMTPLRSDSDTAYRTLEYRYTCRAERQFYPLARLLFDYQGKYKASDPRDYVFGVLGLCEDVKHVRANYTASIRDVFTDAATYSLLHFRNPDILYRACRPMNASSTYLSSLPSWVPDWAETPVRPIEQLCEVISLHQPLLACGRDPRHQVYAEDPGLAPGLLLLSGVYVDRITKVGVILHDKNNFDLNTEDVDDGMRRIYVSWVQDLIGNICSEPNIHLPSPESDTIAHAIRKDKTAEEVTEPEHDGSIVEVVKQQFASDISGFWQHLLAPTLSEERASELIRFFFTLTLSGLNEGRRAVCTEAGYIGWAPHCVKKDDIIVVFFDGKVPFVLRPLDNGHDHLVGDAFIWGIMHGEAMEGEPGSQGFILE